MNLVEEPDECPHPDDVRSIIQDVAHQCRFVPPPLGL